MSLLTTPPAYDEETKSDFVEETEKHHESTCTILSKYNLNLEGCKVVGDEQNIEWAITESILNKDEELQDILFAGDFGVIHLVKDAY